MRRAPGGGPRLPEPAIAADVTGKEVDRATRAQLRTLAKDNAEGVAQHLVMVSRLLDDDPQAALAHAEVAARRAGRVPAVREALGLVAYRLGDYARALRELRTARRLSGTDHLLPHIADCERGLGRPERALALIRDADPSGLDDRELAELAVVASGARRDLGQLDAALAALEIPALRRRGSGGNPRLAYAYADALLARGDTGKAREWFSRAAELDTELETDAAERLDELDGVQLVDLLDELGEGDDDSAEVAEDQPAAADDEPGVML
jgi:tetratricopeptide (TPR) repeat protein